MNSAKKFGYKFFLLAIIVFYTYYSPQIIASNSNCAKTVPSFQEKPMFTASIFAWFPDGKIERISPMDGIYYQSCVHPQGNSAIFFGGASGFPRIWKEILKPDS